MKEAWKEEDAISNWLDQGRSWISTKVRVSSNRPESADNEALIFGAPQDRDDQEPNDLKQAKSSSDLNAQMLRQAPQRVNSHKVEAMLRRNHMELSHITIADSGDCKL